MKKKVMHKAKKGNPMLNKIHEAERSVYSQKLDIALQMGFDAACLAAHDVLQLGEGRFLKFADAYRERLNAIASLFATDTPDCEYSVEKLDEAMKRVSGEKNHTTFKQRYFG